MGMWIWVWVHGWRLLLVSSGESQGCQPTPYKAWLGIALALVDRSYYQALALVYSVNGRLL